MAIKKIIKITQIIFTGFLFSVSLILVASRFGFLPKNITAFSIMSGSMEPTIGAGSIAFVVPKRIYTPNDIIAFNSKGATVVHRINQTILKSTDIVYLTKGDANNAVDTASVWDRDIFGKVIFALPFIGNLKTPAGFAIIVALPALLLIIFESINLKKEVEKLIEQKAKELYEKRLAY